MPHKDMSQTLQKEMEEDQDQYQKLACWCNNNNYEKDAFPFAGLRCRRTIDCVSRQRSLYRSQAIPATEQKRLAQPLSADQFVRGERIRDLRT